MEREILSEKEAAGLRDLVTAYITLNDFFTAFNNGKLGIFFGDKRMNAVKSVVFDKLSEISKEIRETYGINIM